MDIATRYDRWLAMMCVLMSLYMTAQFVWDGSYAQLWFPGSVGLYMLHKLYKGGAGGWQQIAGDLGGGVLTLSIVALMIWSYFLIRS